MKSASEIWETAKGALRVQVARANYDTWLKDSIGVSYQGNCFTVGTPRAFAKEWLEQRLRSLVQKTLISITNNDALEVRFHVCTPADAKPQPHANGPARNGHEGRELLPVSGLSPRYTFSDFVVGDCNRLAYAAALGVAEDPGSDFNPLYIYGGHGLGKTHLVQALGNEASANGTYVVYTSGQQFTNDFVNAVREKSVNAFRRRFADADLFIMEDIHFLLGKQQTQICLYYIMEELYQAGRHLVITGNRPLQRLDSLTPELSSRLESGLVIMIQPPDEGTCLAILRAKAKQHQAVVDEETLALLAARCKSDTRKLEGLLKRVIAYAKMTCRSVDVDLAQEALSMVAAQSPERPSTVELGPLQVLTIVAESCQTSLDSLQGKARDAHLNLARQICVYLLREKLNYSLQTIGRLLGRDHSTVQRSYQKFCTLLQSDPQLRAQVDSILARLA